MTVQEFLDFLNYVGAAHDTQVQIIKDETQEMHYVKEATFTNDNDLGQPVVFLQVIGTGQITRPRPAESLDPSKLN